MLTLLLGPSGSGKSSRLRAQIKSRAQAGQRSLLLVPEQFTSSTEAALYGVLGDTLSGFVESYSFTSLAEALLRRYGGVAVPTLSEAGRAVLVRRALDSLLDKVVYYSRQRRSTAFCQKMAETIEELKSAGVRPDTLARYAQGPGADTEKLSELALIYGAYESLLAQTAMDPGDRQELAARRLREAGAGADFFSDRAVYIDEFDTFNAPKRALLEAMLPATDLTVSLCCDGLQENDGGVGVFSGARQVAGTLKALAAHAGIETRTITLTEDLRHRDAPALAELGLLLAVPGYTPEQTVRTDASGGPAILYCQADSRQEEAKAAAAAIKACARAGVPYNRMAVICRDAATYLSAVRYEFRLQNIPLFFDEPTTPENTAPARAVHAALALLRGGISGAALLQLLKTGLLDLEEEAACALENYAYTWPLRAEDWRQPFTRNPSGYVDSWSEQDKQDLELAEKARDFLAGRAGKFIDRARGADVTQLTKQIYLFMEDLGAPRALEKLAESLRAQGELPAADETLREWNVVTGLLNELVQLAGMAEGKSNTLTPGEYDELFTLLLRTTDMGHIPQSLDSVIFTTAGRMRLPETDACFVLGLAEGEFPQTPADRGLLTHADRDVMIAQGAELPDCFENRMIREQVCFYKAMTAAARWLWLSWPGGAAGLPVTSAIAPALRLLEVPAWQPAPAELGAAPAAALDLLGSVWQQPTPQRAAVEAALQQLEGTPAEMPGYAAIRRAARREPAMVQDTLALEKLLGRRLLVSPTRFERYASCPFGYFMQYVLRAKPRQKAELAPNISGTLTHWVLEQALRRYRDTFREMTAEEIAAMVDTLVAEYTAASLPADGVRMQYLIERIARNLKELLGFIQRDLRQSGFKPVAFELRIQDEPDPEDPAAPTVPPVELTDGAGHTIRVIGTVDRVDAMELGGNTYLRVVDYKTGSKKFDLREVWHGLDCQMLLYLFTLVQNGGALFPNPKIAGVEYLWADPAPATESRPAQDAEPEPAVYPLEGLLIDEESIYRAMDTRGTGAFVPLRFSAKTGQVTAQAAKQHLASEEKFARIRSHLDSLLTRMAENLYGGNIAAVPFAPSSKSPCIYCDYRAVCRHADGEGERDLEQQQDPFE